MAGLSDPSRVLTLNAGSSSLKASVRDAADAEPDRLLVERVGTHRSWDQAFDEVERLLAGAPPDVVSHRIVHGGPRHHAPTTVDDALVRDLEDVVALAPLHVPAALETLAVARSRWPGATHVACFDTGFHAGLPEVSRRLPVSRELTDLGVRRYGFHGLSVESVLTLRPDLRDLVVAHLGSGCSVTAVDGERRSRHTSMALSPDSGMMSSTRAGDLDPEVLLYLAENHGYTPAALREELNRRSGLIGVSGGLRDVRDLLASPEPGARLALEMFVGSAAMAIAAAATTLDTWQSLVFTGGVGENAAQVRDRICARLRLDGVAVEVVPADEERVLDRLARDLLG